MNRLYTISWIWTSARSGAFCWRGIFNVHDPEEERTLEDTVQAALRQIQEKQYDVKLRAAGFSEDKICSYGFAFEGKKVLIG